MSLYISLVSVLVLHAFSIPAAPRDTYPRQSGIDIDHYSFELTLTDDSDEIIGVATVSFRVIENGTQALYLDLVGRSEDTETGMIVSSVSMDDDGLRFEHRNNRLRIQLPHTRPSDELLQIQVDYAGIPGTGLKIGPNKYGDRTFFSDNWPNRARHWLPTIDHPYDKATSTFEVTAPAHYQVVSNGVLEEESDLPGAMRLTRWENHVPIATWLYNLGVAEFAVQHVAEFDGKSIQTWVYRQDRDAGFYDFAEPSRQVLEFFSDFVGPYAYEKLANIQSNSVGGGMEAASSIFYGDNSVTGTRSVRWRNVVIHEIAHQWFGNAVTEADWNDVWLSEGFATYFTLLFREHASGKEDFVSGLKQARDRVFSFYADHPDYRIVHENLSDMTQVTSSQTYQKGAWILHMLRNRLGDNSFRRGIRSYYLRYFNQNATTEDFRHSMEEASGEDLSLFFSEWLHSGGNIMLDGTWMFDTAESSLKISMRQVQEDGMYFATPVEVGIYSDGRLEPEIVTLQLVGSDPTELSAPVTTRPDSVSVDPRTVLLARWNFSEK